MAKLILTVSLIVIVLIIVGGGIWVFYNMNQKSDDNFESFDLHIAAMNKSDSFVITDYVILIEGETIPFYEGTTLNGFDTIKMKTNNSFYILNTGSKDYYAERTLILWNDNMIKGYKYIHMLPSIGKINIIQHNTLADDDIFIRIEAEKDNFRSAKLCMRWSVGILKLEINNFIDCAIPSRLINKVDKCVDTKTTLFENNTLDITIKTTQFGNLPDQYVEMYIIDSDRRYWNDTVVSEDLEGKDIGMEDILYLIE